MRQRGLYHYNHWGYTVAIHSGSKAYSEGSFLPEDLAAKQSVEQWNEASVSKVDI